MKIEVRADDTVKIEGYVNAVERESQPIITARGRVNERIEAGVFQRAINAASDIPATVDHDPERVIASTKNGTLKLQEDAIGLRAKLETKSQEVADAARAGKIKGWSFGMRNITDDIEERGKDALPLRHIKNMTLDHVTLVIRKNPCYSATSVEVRAEGTVETEERSMGEIPEVEAEEKKPDYSKFEEAIKRRKGQA